jgi:hypothetical protein
MTDRKRALVWNGVRLVERPKRKKSTSYPALRSGLTRLKKQRAKEQPHDDRRT